MAVLVGDGLDVGVGVGVVVATGVDPPPPGFFVELGFGELVLRPAADGVGVGVGVTLGAVVRVWLRDAAVAVRLAAASLEGVDDDVAGVGDGVRVGADGPGEVGPTDAVSTPCALGTPSAAWVPRSGEKPTTSAEAVRSPAAVVTTTGPLRCGLRCLPIDSVSQGRRVAPQTCW